MSMYVYSLLYFFLAIFSATPNSFRDLSMPSHILFYVVGIFEPRTILSKTKLLKQFTN